MAFTITIYRATREWPSDEKFGLTSQIRRASCSIPANISEGAGNDSDKEFCRFLEIALRSGYEVMTEIEIALGLEFLANDKANALLKEADEIAAMIVGLMKSFGWQSSRR